METRTLAGAAALLLMTSAARYGLALQRAEPLLLPDSADVLPALLQASEAELEEAERRALRLAPGEKIDPNRASEIELDRLPGVGPALATAIVAEREAGGAFRSGVDLTRTRGLGPATLTRLAPFLDLPAGAPPGTSPPPGRRREGADGGRPGDSGPAPAQRIDIERASTAELQRVPGIGPVMAARIVQFREERGGIGRAETLLEVSGIGVRTLEKLRPWLRFSGG